jgi:hypothetical protein
MIIYFLRNVEMTKDRLQEAKEPPQRCTLVQAWPPLGCASELWMVAGLPEFPVANHTI